MQLTLRVTLLLNYKGLYTGVVFPHGSFVCLQPLDNDTAYTCILSQCLCECFRKYATRLSLFLIHDNLDAKAMTPKAAIASNAL